mgnify:CR=1 FL=1
MTIDKTSRKETLTGTASSGEVFTVPFAVENTSEVSVYNPQGNMMKETVDYIVTGHGLPATSTNTVTVTWVGTSPLGAITFYRTSTMLQAKDLSAGYKTSEIETVFDRATLSYQNALKTTSNIFDTEGGRIQVMGEPIEDSDAVTLGYAQGLYSITGYIPTPVDKTDNDKAVYAYSTTQVIWRDPFDIPYEAASSKLLQVDGTGNPVWVTPVQYAPAFPSSHQYLSLDGSLDLLWRAPRQLPLYANGNVGDSVVAQQGGTIAWHPVRWLDTPPTLHKHLWNSTGTGADGAIYPEATAAYTAAKGTYLDESDTDANYGAHGYALIKSYTDNNAYPIFEWDLSALTPSDYTMDTIISVNLRLRFVSGYGAARTMVIKRMPDTFVQGTGQASNSYNDDGATWEKPNAPGGNDWGWIDGGTNDLDHELPVSTFVIGAGVSTSAYTYVDVTQLFLDALHRRSGILRIMMYDTTVSGSSIWSKFHSNSASVHKIRLEVAKATKRRGYWQPWNYHQEREKNYPSVDFGEQISMENYQEMQPHLTHFGKTVDAAEVKGGHHPWMNGYVVGCSYAISPVEMPADHALYIHDCTSGWDGTIVGSLYGFPDRSGGVNENIDASTTLRTSAIFMETEPGE